MITIVLPISRTDYLKPVFDCLKALECPEDTELLIITDGNMFLQKAVERRLESLSFAKIQVINFGDKPEESINDRRYRISAIHNKARHFLSEDCEYVFLVEDDTTYPPDTIERLKDGIKQDPNITFMQGVELGRRKNPYVGSWEVNDVFKPTLVKSQMPDGIADEAGITKRYADAGGFYCALVDADLYKMHHFEPFDKNGTNGLSCDVNFCLYLRQQGYKCATDWSIQCDHIGDKGSVNLGNTKPEQVIFEKHNNRWTSIAK